MNESTIDHGQTPTASLDDTISQIIEHTQGHVVLAIPLGLGKPNQLVNALYQHIKRNPHYRLKIVTALSLSKPKLKSELEKRLVEPILNRIFNDYAELDYVADIKNNSIPANIQVCEFFFQTATQLTSFYAQQNYISSNYTHVARDLKAHKVNVMAQLISKRVRASQVEYSLSCNPEVTLDLVALFKADPDYPMPLRIAQVHEDLPFMVNDAQIPAHEFDIIIDNPSFRTTIFSTPNSAISLVDHAIGFHASTLIKDSGTLQIGIGSLGDSIANNLIIRHTQNALYQNIYAQQHYDALSQNLIQTQGGTKTFKHGLYGCSEMFVPGFMELKKHGVLKRLVYADRLLQDLINRQKIFAELQPNTLDILYDNAWFGDDIDQAKFDRAMHFGIFASACSWVQDDQTGPHIVAPSGERFKAELKDAANRRALAQACLGQHLQHGVLLHGGFFLGHQQFYQELRELSEAERQQIHMTNISFINDIHWQTELKCVQRQHARYLNTAFLATLLGASSADMLEDGRVLSGVGGQYNFVAQAHEIGNGRSIIMLRSTRKTGGQISSNIVWNYGHTTIPRHLRDIYISEYGIADTRGKSDSDVIKMMLNISDSRFQEKLLKQAKQAGKIAANYAIPEAYKNNYPSQLKHKFGAGIKARAYCAYPFGNDLTADEQALASALTWLKNETLTSRKKIRSLIKAYTTDITPYMHLLERMQLTNGSTFKEKIMRQLVAYALHKTQQQ